MLIPQRNLQQISLLLPADDPTNISMPPSHGGSPVKVQSISYPQRLSYQEHTCFPNRVNKSQPVITRLAFMIGINVSFHSSGPAAFENVKNILEAANR
jgi:hypothetical protein